MVQSGPANVGPWEPESLLGEGVRSAVPPIGPRHETLDPPGQRFVEPAPELEVVGSVDDAIAVEIEKRLVAATGGLVEGGPKAKVVAGIDDRFEVGCGNTAAGSGRSAGIAEEAMKCRRRVAAGQVDGRQAYGMNFGGIDHEV